MNQNTSGFGTLFQLVDRFEPPDAEVDEVEGSGEVTVRMDGTRSRLVPVSLRRAPEGAQPGAAIDETATSVSSPSTGSK